MWAFLIYDSFTGSLFGSRDRFGIKPLFVWREASTYLFCSEIKGIRASGLYADETNWDVAAKFLVQGAIDEGNNSFYKGIDSIPPGKSFELTTDGVYRETRFWFPPEPTGHNDRQIYARFAELFENVVSIHSRSDVPLAVHLSGGLDSTSIICALARQRDRSNCGQEIRAFSYVAEEFDESKYIHDTLKQTHAIPVRLSVTPAQLWASLEKMLWFQDEPVHTMTALVNYALMQQTAQHGIKVVLNGQGADGTLAGYPSYFISLFHELLLRNRFVAFVKEMRAQAHARNESFWSSMASALVFSVRAIVGRLHSYRAVAVKRRNAALDKFTWYTPDLLERLKGQPFVSYDLKLHDALLRSIFQAPLPLYLRVEDRNAMAWSVESRVPFLDYRLVEFALAADCQELMRSPYNKQLLRIGMSGRIPDSVLSRVEKQGFPTPARKWLSGELFEPLFELVNSRLLAEAGVIDRQTVTQDMIRFKQGKVDLSTELFRVAQFAVWLKKQEPARP